jgi:hypothetical protein
MSHKKFETGDSRSVAVDDGTLFMKRTQYSTNDEVYAKEKFDTFYESLEEED